MDQNGRAITFEFGTAGRNITIELVAFSRHCPDGRSHNVFGESSAGFLDIGKIRAGRIGKFGRMESGLKALWNNVGFEALTDETNVATEPGLSENECG